MFPNQCLHSRGSGFFLRDFVMNMAGHPGSVGRAPWFIFFFFSGAWPRGLVFHLCNTLGPLLNHRSENKWKFASHQSASHSKLEFSLLSRSVGCWIIVNTYEEDFTSQTTSDTKLNFTCVRVSVVCARASLEASLQRGSLRRLSHQPGSE